MEQTARIPVSGFAQDEYGISAVSPDAMLKYGYALLVIVGADRVVTPRELDWLVRHQRKFGAPEEVIAKYADFDYQNADLAELVRNITVDVATWIPGPHLIYHAIQMCSVDGEYAAAERAKVHRAAHLLSVPPDVTLAIHALVDMEHAVHAMRKALFHVDTLEEDEPS